MDILGYNVTTNLENIKISGEGSTVLINTINPHSYVLAKKDSVFREALMNSSYLIPDGSGIVLASMILKGKKIPKIAGADLHEFLLEKLNVEHGICFYLGSNPKTLDLIRDRLGKEYPNITAGFYSPPYKEEFTEEDSNAMIEAVNGEIANSRNGENFNSPIHQFTSSPVLFIGMTAPKQEKWSYRQRERLDAGIICNIGAVFDFYAGTVKRSSPFWIKIGLEWLPRFFREPKRLYRRVFVSGPLFLWDVFLFRIGIK